MIKRKITLLFVLAILITFSLIQRSVQADQSPNTALTTSGAPLSASVLFVENVGQFADKVRFSVAGSQGALFLTEDGLWMTLYGYKQHDTEELDNYTLTPADTRPDQGVSLHLSFDDADMTQLEPFNRSSTTVSYFKGATAETWHTEVPAWEGVRYKNLYPGIDLLLFGIDGRWSWQLEIQKGFTESALQAVRLHSQGADTLAVDEQLLHLNTVVGNLTLPLLPVYSADGDRLAPTLPPSVTVGNKILSPFTTSQPTPSQFGPDSLPNYATYFGGSNNDDGDDIALDAYGNMYMLIHTWSADIMTTPGAFDPTYNGGPYGDAFIVRINADGTLVAATYLGGSDDDSAEGIAVDEDTFIYVTGLTASTDFPTTLIAFDTSHNGSDDVYVTKLWPSGNHLMYSTFIGGSNMDQSYDIAVWSNRAYVTGVTNSCDFPITQGVADPYCDSGGEAFVLKLNESGANLTYSTYYGGFDSERGLSIAVDTSGKAYFVGTTTATTADAFLAKYNFDATGLEYFTYLGGSGSECYVCALAVDATGSAYVTGVTTSTDFPTTPGAFDNTYNGGNEDLFVMKFNPGGTVNYATYVGGSGNEGGSGIVVDSTGKAYITGSTTSADFPVTSGAFDQILDGFSDAIGMVINPSGSNLAYATFIGGSNVDYGNGVAVEDISGVFYVVGSTNSADFPTTPDAIDGTYNGNYDAFIIKLGGDPAATTDLVPYALEITQAVQDLNNSVDLVESKRSFVRFYVSSSDPSNAPYRTYARLRVEQGSHVVWLDPIGADRGHINVQSTTVMNRGTLGDTFLFELPSAFTHGTITLTGVVNPTTDWRSRNPLETDYTNNEFSTTVQFEPVPPLNLLIYEVGYYYLDGGILHYQPPPSLTTEITTLDGRLRRVYPISDLNLLPTRTLVLSLPLIPDPTDYDVGVNCARINLRLADIQSWDMLYGVVPLGTRYYGMADEPTGINMFRFGCAWPTMVETSPFSFKAGVGSGETGQSWLPIHELGHTYGRLHTPSSDQPGICSPASFPTNPFYPYLDANISPTTDENDPTAIFGFSIDSYKVYPPEAKDFMSYCYKSRWTSDYTYEGLMDLFQNPLFPVGPLHVTSTDRLHIVGNIDLSSGEIAISPLFVIPNAPDLEPRTPGDYAIVLRDVYGDELARYPFMPDEGHSRDGEFLLITELVPYVNGTTQVEIEGTQGEVLYSVLAGEKSPTVQLLSPNGGETLSDSSVLVEWIAGDSDGDPLTFLLQYSTDNGSTWKVAADNLTDTSVELSTDQLPGSGQGLFRVWVSDGIHTAADASDAPFTVPNRTPTAEIITPDGQVTIAISQTLALEAYAYDLDTGMMDGSQLQWTSSVDGFLGNGRHLSLTGLALGLHTITLLADDGSGGTASDTVQVTVVANPSQLPPLPDRLTAGPPFTHFDPVGGHITATISIDNENILNSLPWTAVTDQPWVQLNKDSGNTPDRMVANYNESSLSPGYHEATITITNSISPTDQITITVGVAVEKQIYVSLDNSGTVGSVSYDDEDILVYETDSDIWSLYFDGSDVGLAATDIDALYLVDDGSILMSFDTPINLGGTIYDDSDIVQFRPQTLGNDTTGDFQPYFDGSDVGLTIDGEDVDAIGFNQDGMLLISTIDTIKVFNSAGNGLEGKGEDLFVFEMIQLGTNTNGTWYWYFDGSDVGLTSASENITGVWVDAPTGHLQLSTFGAFAVAGLNGDGQDIFTCQLLDSVNETSCDFSSGIYWDGSEYGIGTAARLDGFFISP